MAGSNAWGGETEQVKGRVIEVAAATPQLWTLVLEKFGSSAGTPECDVLEGWSTTTRTRRLRPGVYVLYARTVTVDLAVGGANMGIRAVVVPGASPADVAAVTRLDSALDGAQGYTTVGQGIATVAFLNPNPDRVGLYMRNDATADVHVAFGSAVVNANPGVLVIPPAGYWEAPLPVYRGAVKCAWTAAGAGSLRVVEFSGLDLTS